jgi:hypothetical protein
VSSRSEGGLVDLILRPKIAPIWMVLEGSSASICMTFASSAALKEQDEAGMAKLVEGGGMQRHSSLSLAAVILAVASSMLFCSQSSAR